MLFSGTTFWWDSLWFPMIISHRSERAKVRKMDSELLSPLASDKSSSQRLERDLPVSQMESESIKWQTKTYKGNKVSGGYHRRRKTINSFFFFFFLVLYSKCHVSGFGLPLIKQWFHEFSLNHLLKNVEIVVYLYI